MMGLNIRARSSKSLSLRKGQFQLRDVCRIALAALLLIAGVKLMKCCTAIEDKWVPAGPKGITQNIKAGTAGLSLSSFIIHTINTRRLHQDGVSRPHCLQQCSPVLASALYAWASLLQ